MSLNTALVLVLVFIIIYVLIIDTFTFLFRITGLTTEKSRFQVISLFTNAGFTTRESEIITSSPKRRKLAKITMVSGHIFSALIVSLIVAILSNISTMTVVMEHLYIILIIMGVLLVTFIVLKIPPIAHKVQNMVDRLTYKTMGKHSKDNVITELDSYGSSSILEVYINVLPHELEDKPLYDTNLKGNYNLNLLLVKRKNKILDVTANTILQKKDLLVIFGPSQNVKDLFGPRKAKNTEEMIKESETTNELTIIDNYGTDAMVEIRLNKVPEYLREKTLLSTGIKDNYQINVMMITRGGNVIQINKDTMFMDGDDLVVFGPYQKIKDIFIK